MPLDFNLMFLLKGFVKTMEKMHYRFFAISLLIHTLIYGLGHLAFEPAELFEAYLVDLALLAFCVFGTARKMPILILPSVIVKTFLVAVAVIVSMMCLSNMNIDEKTREDRMKFRRQRNYPEVINILLEDHPSVCIWIYLVMTLVVLDLSNAFKALYGSCDCLNRKKEEIEKPPSYSKCVSKSQPPPTYSEAIRLQNLNKNLSSDPNFHVV